MVRLKVFIAFVVFCYFVTISNSTSWAQEDCSKHNIMPFVRKYINQLDASKTTKSLEDYVADLNCNSDVINASITRIAIIMDYNQFLKKRINYLLAASSKMIARPDFMDFSDTDGIYAVRGFSEKLKSITEEFDNNTLVFKDAVGQKGVEDLQGIISILNKLREDLGQQYEELQQLSINIRKTNQKALLVSQVKGREAIGHREVVLNKVGSRPHDHFSKKQNVEIDMLRKDLKQVRMDFAMVTARQKKTEDKVLNVTKELASMSLDLFSKDKMLNDRNIKNGELERELYDAQERLNLVQHIMSQKDKKIADLEGEVEILNSDLSQTVKIDNVSFEISENTNESTANTQQGLKASSPSEKVGPSVVIDKLKMKEMEIFQLRDRLNKMEGEVNALNRIFNSKDQKLLELVSMLEIYKGKLYDAQVDMTKSNERILDMARELKELKEILNLHKKQASNTKSKEGPFHNRKAGTIHLLNAGNIHNWSEDAILNHTVSDIDKINQNMQFKKIIND